MTAYNVAVVFGPAFIRPEVFLPADILEYNYNYYFIIVLGLLLKLFSCLLIITSM
jgi:hypothetical protein